MRITVRRELCLCSSPHNFGFSIAFQPPVTPFHCFYLLFHLIAMGPLRTSDISTHSSLPNQPYISLPLSKTYLYPSGGKYMSSVPLCIKSGLGAIRAAKGRYIVTEGINEVAAIAIDSLKIVFYLG